jgi:molybdate transport system ATP-binding protein
VALARALACEPELLLLDEPFAALNPMLRQSLRQELALVRERWRVPMLLITHDVEDVLALADVACVLEQGRVVREVDVHRGIGREALHSGLGLPPPPVEDDRTRAVRRCWRKRGRMSPALAGPWAGGLEDERLRALLREDAPHGDLSTRPWA